LRRGGQPLFQKAEVAHGDRNSGVEPVTAVQRVDAIKSAIAWTIAPRTRGPEANQKRLLHLGKLLGEVVRACKLLKSGQAGIREKSAFSIALGIVIFAAPNQTQSAEIHAAAATAATATKRIVFQQAQTFRNP